MVFILHTAYIYLFTENKLPNLFLSNRPLLWIIGMSNVYEHAFEKGLQNNNTLFFYELNNGFFLLLIQITNE